MRTSEKSFLPVISFPYFADKLLQEQLHITPGLVQEISKGDEPSFRVLFDRFTPMLLVFVERIVKSKADAEEIVQETMARVWMNRSNLVNIENPGRYIYVMARNKALDRLRQITRNEKLLQQVWVFLSAGTDNSLEEKLRTDELRQLVEQSLQHLPARKQQVYRLSREHGLSQAEIADELGISKSRVNNILVETLRYIRGYLEQHSELMAIVFWISSWKNLF